MPGEDRQRPATLAGFRVVSELGRGGMGVVYAGWDDKLLRRVALKLIAEELSTSADLRDRFLREARASAALSHPNICAVHAIETVEDGRLLLVMELVGGQSLRARLVAGDLSRAEARSIALGIAAALAKAHTVGIVHRDLKPENVMVGDDGTAKLLDFGIAKALARGPALDTSGGALTGSGQVVGTAGYIAPEQIEGFEADQRVDVFAFGVVLFEMLGGVRPFDGATPVQRMVAVMRDAPANLAATAPDVPPALRDLIGRCLAKRADDRPLDGATLRRELEAAWSPGSSSASSSNLLPGASLDTAPTEASLDTPAARRIARGDAATDATEAVQTAPRTASVTAAAGNAATPRAAGRTLMLATLGALAVGTAVWVYARREEPAVTPSTTSAVPSSSVAPVASAPLPSESPSPRESSNKSHSAGSGRLPPEVIQTTIRDRFAGIRKCADSIGTRTVARSVWFVIALDGSTRDVAVREVDPSLAEMDACLVAAFSAIRFPKPDGGVVTVTYPMSFGNRDGPELDDATCAAQVGCLEQGRCSAHDDACAVVTDADCRLAQVCTESGACTADRGKCRPRYTDCAPTAEACRRYGLCTLEDGFCRATKDADCANAIGCPSYGLCIVDRGVCRAPSNDVCEQSEVCKGSGRCAEGNGECIANRSADCEQSSFCTVRGQCVLRAGVCVAGREEDCRKSAECGTEGRCKVGQTLRCIAASDADCKASTACKDGGHCKAAMGFCIEQ